MSRANYLTKLEHQRLRSWAHHVQLMFDRMPYLVGSATQRRDYRDVDVRTMIDQAPEGIDLWFLNLAVGAWGQLETGLPIDFQAQLPDEFHSYDGEPRHAVGLQPSTYHRSRQPTRRCDAEGCNEPVHPGERYCFPHTM